MLRFRVPSTHPWTMSAAIKTKWSLNILLPIVYFGLWKRINLRFSTSMSNTPKLSRFIIGTLRFDSIRTLRLNSIRTESHLANRLPAWRIDNRGNDSCRFDWIESNRQHFQPTLHSPLEVKIRKITIHEPSSFLKRGHKPQSIRTIRADSIESTRIGNIFNPPSKSRSTVFSQSRSYRLPAWLIDRWGNDSCRFDGIGFTNRFPVCRIANTKDDPALFGCIGQPSSGQAIAFLILPDLFLGQSTFQTMRVTQIN